MRSKAVADFLDISRSENASATLTKRDASATFRNVPESLKYQQEY